MDRRAKRLASNLLRPGCAIAPLAIVAALTACGGGGGGGGSAAVAKPDTLALQFPPPHGLTDDPRLELLGTTTRPRQVARVDAVGVPATTTDGFAHWAIDFALSAPTTQFDIAARDANGNVLSTAASTIEFAPLVESRHAIAFDPQRNVVLIADVGNDDRLIGLDLASGRPKLISGGNVGSGPALGQLLFGVAVDPAQDAAYVLSLLNHRICKVQLFSGSRILVSDDFKSGPDLASPEDLDLDLAHNRLLVPDRSLDAIVAVDLTTGTRTILSDATHGSGPTLVDPERIAVAPAPGLALIVQRNSSDLLGVDLTTGNRFVVSGTGHGTGPAFAGIESVTFDAASGLAFVGSGDDSIFQVNVATGARKQLVLEDNGGPIHLTGIGDLFLMPDGRAVTSVGGLNTLVAIDLARDERTDLEVPLVGAGPRLTFVVHLAADADSAECFALETNFRGFPLVAIDARTGDRRIVSDPDVNGGPVVQNPLCFTVATRRGIGLAVDNFLGAMVAYDLATGERSIVSDASHGGGTPIQASEAITIDDPQDLAYVVDFDATGPRLVSVNLFTGDRTEISGANRGNGPDFNLVTGLAVERSGESVLAVDVLDDVLYRIDLATGDRLVIASRDDGKGAQFAGLDGGLALAADHQHAFLSAAGNLLFDVDLATGDRSLVLDPATTHGPAFVLVAPFTALGEKVLFSRSSSVKAIVEIDLASGHRVASSN